MNKSQFSIGVAVLVIAAVMGIGSLSIRADSGYSGVSPAFLPLVVCAALSVCGVLLCWQAWRGGFNNVEVDVAEKSDWQGFAWVSVGLLLNAALINHLGFVFSCTLLFMLAARGFRGKAPLKQWLLDFATGVCLSAPTFWLFTKGLGLTLPALTKTGWL